MLHAAISMLAAPWLIDCSFVFPMIDREVSRRINWMESTSRSLKAQFSRDPVVVSRADAVVERLSVLLLERLTPELAINLLELLPSPTRDANGSLLEQAECAADRSIGFPDFMEEAERTLGIGEIGVRDEDDTEERDLRREIADAYLWAIVQEIPAEMKIRLREILPAELRSRMDLYSSKAEEARVA